MTGDLALIRAVRALRDGAVIAYPTEGVWGLGCDPFNRDAVEFLLALKRRPSEKGLILIAAESDMFAPLLDPLPASLRHQLDASWPGPNTWIVPDPDHLSPPWIRGRHNSLAVRVTAHPQAARLSRAFGGPLILNGLVFTAVGIAVWVLGRPSLATVATTLFFALEMYVAKRILC